MLDMIRGTPLSAVRTVKPMEMQEDGQSLPLRGYVAAGAISIMEFRQRKRQHGNQCVPSPRLNAPPLLLEEARSSTI